MDFAQSRRSLEKDGGFVPTHQGAAGSVECGHYFQLQLAIDAQGIVTDLVFQCPHCRLASACGDYLYQRLVGRRADQKVTAGQVLQSLRGLPSHRRFSR